jgi:hypothetical protein
MPCIPNCRRTRTLAFRRDMTVSFAFLQHTQGKKKHVPFSICYLKFINNFFPNQKSFIMTLKKLWLKCAQFNVNLESIKQKKLQRLWNWRSSSLKNWRICKTYYATTCEKQAPENLIYDFRNFALKLLIKWKSLNKCFSWPGLPDFSWYNIPKRGKIYQIATKYTKWPQNISNGRKIYQIHIKYTKIYYCKTHQNLPKLGFWVWSGNPARDAWHVCRHLRPFYGSGVQAIIVWRLSPIS